VASPELTTMLSTVGPGPDDFDARLAGATGRLANWGLRPRMPPEPPGFFGVSMNIRVVASEPVQPATPPTNDPP
jgi:hypothetical protein